MQAARRPRIDMATAVAMDLIGKIADRAVAVYASHDIRVARQDVLMDISTVHLSGSNKLRLEEFLAADDQNFIHDIAGINRHLDRETGKLMDCFSPRFSLGGGGHT